MDVSQPMKGLTAPSVIGVSRYILLPVRLRGLKTVPRGRHRVMARLRGLIASPWRHLAASRI
jgi:hypothetical protein